MRPPVRRLTVALFLAVCCQIEEHQTARLKYISAETCHFRILDDVARRACSSSPPGGAACQVPSLSRMHTLVDKIIIG